LPWIGVSPEADHIPTGFNRDEMARLRARLSKFYSTEGGQNKLVIDLPKGSHVQFRRPEHVRSYRERPNAWGSQPARVLQGRDGTGRGGLSQKVRPSRLQFSRLNLTRSSQRLSC
jgi:hypothetical protein